MKHHRAESNVQDIGLVKFAQGAIEENEQDVLRAHISSRLETDTAKDGGIVISDDV